MECLVDSVNFLPNEVFPDSFMRREISAFKVPCPFMKDGCPWKGEVRYLEVHIETKCYGYPITCGKCNKDGISRGKLKDHQDLIFGDCEAVQVQGPCPFSQIGCPKRDCLNQREKKQHLQKAFAQHSVLLLQLAIRTSKEYEAILTRDPRIMSRSPQLLTNHDSLIQDLQNQLQIRTDEIRSLQGKLQENSRRITILERTLASGTVSGGASYYLRDVGNLKRQLDTTQESCRRHDRRIESIEHTLALRNVTLADLEEYVRQQEISSYDGQLLWKISDYARKRNDAVTGQQVSFNSPFFYTSRQGYKMCVRLYLNGYGQGKGTHLSMFFVVMRGEYDAGLDWPFRQKVTFMLLDQDGVEHVVEAFTPCLRRSSFQTSSSTIAGGSTSFFPLDEIGNRAYVKNDVMFLKIIVDTSDL
ncbi:TNF receptor-associated factor 2-like isoform X2 [Stylophora pistillata]|nr:TNF receptor-associated factor 2-like isoform X2 [Stylophora pistillata]